MRAVLLAGAVGAVALGTATPAHADDMDAFTAAVKDATGDYNRAWVISKLTKLELGPKCWKKLPDKNGGAIHMASFVTRDIVEIAKTWTGDDWDAIESQNNHDRETNKKLIEPMMDAFKQRLFITIRVDGDDCDAKQNSLWLRYWGYAVGAIKAYNPPSGKAFVTIDVSSKAREVTVDVSKDGTTFKITAPKLIEPKKGSERIERPFRQLASGISDDFAFSSKEATGEYYAAWILTKLHTFKVGKACRAKLGDPDLSAVHSASYVVRDIAEWAKRDMGAEDWDAIEGQSSGDKAELRATVEKDIEAFRKKFTFTVSIDGDDCDAKHGSNWLRYWTSTASALNKYPPKAKKVALTLNVSGKAKDVTVKAAKDGSTITITAPRDIEGPGWSDKIEDAFKKASAKK